MGLSKKNSELKAKQIEKQDKIPNRARDTTWGFVVWLVFGGFISLATIFMMGAILTISIIGAGMATQAFRLGNYIMGGFEEELKPDYKLSKVKNTIWMIIGGWFLYCFHYLMGGIFYITYFGRGIAEMWFETAKTVSFPYGLDLEPEGVN